MTVLRVALLAAVLSGWAAYAQRTSATINGIVTDPSGATVPLANIVATEATTGLKTSAASDADGVYVLVNLAAGEYRVHVDKSGFSTFVQDGIVLTVGQTATLNVRLAVGSQGEVVTVVGAPPQVDSTTQEIKTVVTPEMARDLPLDARNVLELMSLAPDVSSPVPLGQTSQYTQGATRPEATSTFVSASGGRANSTAFYLDGGINEDPYTQVANIFPNPDAIQEFTFYTNSYSAKFGGHGGGLVSAVTRGGANAFHGSAFEFVRNGNLNARNFFALTNDGLKRNQYGFAVGGPVRRNKTFFFLSWQGTKLRSVPSDNRATTGTAAQHAGDFSKGAAKIVDPDTKVQFPGNIIPASRIDPVAVKFLALVPPQPDSGPLTYQTFVHNDDNQWVSRGDHIFSDRFRISGRYLHDRLQQPSNAVANNILTATPASRVYNSQIGTVNGTYVATPNLVNTTTVSVSRVTFAQPGPTLYPSLTQLGVNVPNLVTQGGKVSVQINLSGYFTLSFIGLIQVPRTGYNINHDWTYIRRGHTIEFGIEAKRQDNILYQDFYSDGYFKFTSALSGNNLADLLLGRPAEFLQNSPTYDALRRNTYALYVNDSWKIRRGLTLNLGVRWNSWVPFREVTANEMAVFDASKSAAGVHSTRYPNLPAGLFVGGDPGVPDAGMRSFYRLFDPRVGFAYDPFGNGKTSIRGGFGMYHDDPIGIVDNLMSGQPPFILTTDIPFPASFVNPYAGHVNPFPAPSPVPASTIYPLPFLGSAFDPSMTYPTILQWNFTVERQLLSNLVVRGAYQGSEAYHLSGNLEGNPATYIPGQSTMQNVQNRRPYSQYFTNLILINSLGTSSFNALTISVEKRMSHGLSLIGGYRRSKSLDEASQTNQNHVDYTDPYNVGFDRGVSNFDIPQRFTLSGVWQMPTPHALGFFGKNVIGGWRMSGIFQRRSGFPINILSGIANSLTGPVASQERGDLVGDPNLPSDRSKAQKILQWFNPAAFKQNALGTFGNAPRNFLRGPGFVSLNCAIAKTFTIRESQRVDFRAEAFNAPNHANLYNPGAQVNSSFARIGNAADPRVLQLSLKYVF